MLVGCDIINSTALQSPTSVSPYLHYTPPETSTVHLKFDYLSSWIFNEKKIENTDIVLISLGDPQLLTVPTPGLNESHRVPSDFGRIRIWIEPVESNQTLEVLTESHKQGYDNASWIKPINIYGLKINEVDAIAFEYQVEPSDGNGFSSLMFERNIFFVAKNQLYQITFLVSENERGGEFEQGYEYFFKSIRITP